MASEKLVFTIVFFLSLTASASPEVAEESLFEWGFFIGHGNTADYPASDEYRLRTLPVPFARYRGEIFRSDDEDGTRFRMIKSENLDLDFSFGGSFPTEGDKNQARLNMPQLDWTLEVGPRLLYYFLKNKDNLTVRVGLPVRFSIATDFARWSEVGSVLAPTLQIDRYHFLTENLNLYFICDWNFFSEGEADYFFQVEPQYQTPLRRAYDARAGYAGYDLALAAKYEWHHLNLIVGSRYSDYSESANRQSDLHRTNINWTYFIGLGWLLFESDEQGFE